MANITILKPVGTSRYEVTSNDVDTGWVTCGFWPEDIIHVHKEDGDFVEVHFSHGAIWELSFDGADNVWQVDNVAGTDTITSNAHLATLLQNLRG